MIVIKRAMLIIIHINYGNVNNDSDNNANNIHYYY